MTRWQATQVGKYQILEPLGEGAMGVVYRALDPVLGRTVAIKVMTDALAHDDELRERFLREAQAAGSLQHPNVVTIYDFGEVDGHPFIAMELVEGTDLERILAEKTPLSLSDKLGIVIDVLNGLAYAHKRGIVHRDIKPANVRLDEEGRARIMDFGIAHLSSSNITRTGVMMGTPNYMAPEQVTAGAITPATDIFAVGAALYELLTNTRPFQADTLHGVLYKVVSEMPPDIESVLPGLPHELSVVVRRALAKDPSARYKTATEMATALNAVRALLSNPPHGSTSMSLRSSIETAIATRPTQPTPWRRRQQRTTAFVIGGGALVLVIGTALAVRFLAPPAAPAASGEQTTLAGTATPGSVSGVTQPVDSFRGAAPPATRPPASGTTSAASNAAARPDTARVATEQTRQAMLYRSLQYSARFTRRQAVEAGAPAAAIAAGDASQRSAEASADAGRFDRAADQLGAAIARWSAAARQAHELAATAAPASNNPSRQSSSVPAPTASPSSAPAPLVTPAAPPTTAPTSSAPTAPVTPSASNSPSVMPPVDHTAEIGRAIAAYARAMESRDINELRRAYPGMTSDQQRGFEQFFRSTRSIRAALSVGSVDVEPPNAEARVTGTYEYITSSGSTERQAVSFRAALRRDAGVWRLMSVK